MEAIKPLEAVERERRGARLNIAYGRTRVCPVHRCNMVNGRCIACEAVAWREARGLPVETEDDQNWRAVRALEHEAHRAIAESA